ncbi:MAG: PDZ domain-containing protein, partial [Rhodospirillales bacterium]|nr:PDZ domain-containing protein [Rhodospirillales bacterium]
LVVFSALVIGASLTPALNGCAGDQAGAERVAHAIGVDPYRLDEEGAKELARFNHVFTTYAENPSDIRELKQFRDVYKRIRSNYVSEVSDSALIDAAVKGVVESDAAPGTVPGGSLVDRALEAMTASLDPHSAYLDPEALKESELVTTGEFGGLGIQVTQDGEKIKVISPIEGTPAERAGVQPGDLITHLDRKAITGMSLREAVHAMRGPPGTPILLTLKRGERPSFDVSITRDVISIQPVRWWVQNDVGYVRVASFNEKTADALDTSLDELRKRGRTTQARRRPQPCSRSAQQPGRPARSVAGGGRRLSRQRRHRLHPRPRQGLRPGLPGEPGRPGPGLADGGADQRRLRLGLGNRRRGAAGPRPGGGDGHPVVRQGIGANGAEVATGGCAEADDSALLCAQGRDDPGPRG